MTKYRIKRVNGKFVPQYKTFLCWKYFEYYTRDTGDTYDDGRRIVICATEEEARNYISMYKTDIIEIKD